MKIKVGEYVRTKSGGIGKIIEIDGSHIITDNETFGLGWDGEQVNWEFITGIVKSSTNIIDLIEVGDYVNGKPVEKIEKNEIHLIEITTTTEFLTSEFYIKDIVTKEQFKNMEYEV